MWVVPCGFLRPVCLLALLLLASAPFSLSATSWNGILRDSTGKPMGGAKITLHAVGGERKYEAITAADGAFAIAYVEAGSYTLTAETGDKTWTAEKEIEVTLENTAQVNLT